MGLIVLGLILAIPIDFVVTIFLGGSLVVAYGQLAAQIISVAVFLAGVITFGLGCYRLVVPHSTSN